MTAPEEPPQNVAITNLNDQDFRTVALNLATFINDLVPLPFYEPDADIVEIDAAYSWELYKAPLTYTHQLRRYLLEGVRDSLWVISNSFSNNSMSYIPSAALVRQVAEYSAAAFYISDAEDSARTRIAKMVDMTISSLKDNEHSLEHHPDVRDFYKRSKGRIASWKSGTDLPEVKGANKFGHKSDAMKKLFENLPDEDLGRGYYNRLSGFAHPSAVHLTHAMEMMWRENPPMQAMHYGDACWDVLVGIRCALVAVERSIPFHVPRTELERDVIQVRIHQFRWLIVELLVRVANFRRMAPRLADEAFRVAGIEKPDDFFEELPESGSFVTGPRGSDPVEAVDQDGVSSERFGHADEGIK